MNNLKYFRSKKGLKQKDLAKKLNVAPSTICDLENGNRNFTNENIISICQILEITADDLLNINNDKISFNINKKESLVLKNILIKIINQIDSLNNPINSINNKISSSNIIKGNLNSIKIKKSFNE